MVAYLLELLLQVEHLQVLLEILLVLLVEAGLHVLDEFLDYLEVELQGHFFVLLLLPVDEDQVAGVVVFSVVGNQFHEEILDFHIDIGELEIEVQFLFF